MSKNTYPAQTAPNQTPENRRRLRVTAGVAVVALAGGLAAGCSWDGTKQAVGFAPYSTDQNAWVDYGSYVYAQHGNRLEAWTCGPGGPIKALTDFKHESAQSLKFGSLINPGHCIGTVSVANVTNMSSGNHVGLIIGEPNSGGKFVAHPDMHVAETSSIEKGIVASRPFSPDMIGRLQGYFNDQHASGADLLQSIEQATGIDQNAYPPQVLAHQMDGFYVLVGANVQIDDVADSTEYLQQNIADEYHKPDVLNTVVDGGVLHVQDTTQLNPNMDQIVITYEKTAGLQ